MERWCGKVAIVTGASSGIGASVAEKLVKAGLKVVGFARRSEIIEDNAKKLSEYKGKLYARKVDLTVEKDIVDGFEWTTKNVGPVHILVNNAGLMVATGLAEGDTQAWRTVLDTNILAVTIANREAVKIMRANNIDGHIVHVNSIVGQKVIYLKDGGLYCPSKFALTSYHECLRQELNMLNCRIKLSSIHPGYVKTNFFVELDTSRELLKDAPYLTTDEIADGIMYVLGTPPSVQWFRDCNFSLFGMLEKMPDPHPSIKGLSGRSSIKYELRPSGCC